ncbi:sensor histidine kinase [Flavihumibacter solisilvae]|uniref:sensor histidine kinase n=1 Tax=Flavihumibacter solisilvae TaxID=1349421 RepID=UPI00068B19BA|nr:PAS domain-containing sensor histidine kinase [Flavihumibacter solisilvae]
MKSEYPFAPYLMYAQECLRFGFLRWEVGKNVECWSEGIYRLLETETNSISTYPIGAFFKSTTATQKPDISETLLPQLRTGTCYQGQFNLVTSTGRQIVVSCDARPCNEERSDWIVLVSDITFRQDLENYREMMIEREEQLQQGYWEYDIGNSQLSLSKGIYSLFGIQQVEAPNFNRQFSISNGFDELEHPVTREVTANEEKDSYVREIEVTKADGSQRKLETSGRIFRSPDGKPVKVVGTTRDITRIKTYENEMNQIIQDLNRSNQQLEDFAYVASHDLQEPLRKLIIYSNRLFENLGGKLDDENMAVLNRMQKSAKNMQQLIENLLKYARISTEASRFDTTDLNDVLNQVLSEYELKIKEGGADIDLETLPVIEAYAPQMYQLFSNLVNNALKFTNKTAHPKIRVTSSPLSNQEKFQLNIYGDEVYVRISCIDNGIGFDNQYAEKIFQLFQRLNGKWEYPGTGLGLAICKKIVDTHRGLLYAESKPNEATTFYVILPVHQHA